MSRALLLTLLLGLPAVPTALAQSPEPQPEPRFDVQAEVAPAPAPAARFAVIEVTVAPADTPVALRFSIDSVTAKGGVCSGVEGDTIFRNGFED